VEHSVVFAGFGGQGLLFAGHVLAEAALLEDRQVSWMPSYGPEMRGGSASCTVIIADRPIGSPLVDSVDSLIALNPPSLARFEPIVAANGLLVLNSSLIEAEPTRHDVEVVALPCSNLAGPGSDSRLASIVALGGLLARQPIVAAESVREALGRVLGEKHRDMLAADLAALESGMRTAARLTVASLAD
jgi:2-oxoglutarate ferredoxin oxidoreductase subunit gamma